MDSETAARFPDLDVLLDRLHGLACCGCPDCGPAYMQGGRSADGKRWLAVTLPDGHRIEFIGRTVNECAWKVGRAVTDHLKTPL